MSSHIRLGVIPDQSVAGSTICSVSRTGAPVLLGGRVERAPHLCHLSAGVRVAAAVALLDRLGRLGDLQRDPPVLVQDGDRGVPAVQVPAPGRVQLVEVGRMWERPDARVQRFDHPLSVWREVQVYLVVQRLRERGQRRQVDLDRPVAVNPVLRRLIGHPVPPRKEGTDTATPDTPTDFRLWTTATWHPSGRRSRRPRCRRYSGPATGWSSRPAGARCTRARPAPPAGPGRPTAPPGPRPAGGAAPAGRTARTAGAPPSRPRSGQPGVRSARWAGLRAWRSWCQR